MVDGGSYRYFHPGKPQPFYLNANKNIAGEIMKKIYVSFTPSTSITSTFYEAFMKAAEVMDKGKIPTEGMSMLIDKDSYIALGGTQESWDKIEETDG